MIQLNGLFCISVKATLVMVAPRFPNEDSSGLNRNTSMSLRRQVLLMNTCRRSWKSSGWGVSGTPCFVFSTARGSCPCAERHTSSKYCSVISFGVPIFLILPFSSMMAALHRLFTAPVSWLTNRTVFFSMNWRKKRIHFCVKKASPTDSASSTIKISASTWATTAKARRTAMPLE